MFNAPNFCPYHCILGHTLDDCFVVKNIIPKMIDEGTIDTDLLKGLKNWKKMATTSVATLQDSSVSYAPSNMKPTYDDMMFSSGYEHTPIISPGFISHDGHGTMSQS